MRYGATQCASKRKASIKVDTLRVLFGHGLGQRRRRGSHRECKSLKNDGTGCAIESPGVYLTARRLGSCDPSRG